MIEVRLIGSVRILKDNTGPIKKDYIDDYQDNFFESICKKENDDNGNK